ncbi:hypothetical protein ACFQU7_35710 [Pseudoroseomonas wenyumeiae]
MRYHHRDRRRLADVLTAIRLGRTVETLGRAAERNGERALRSSARMARLFARHPAALGNTLRVLDACSGFSSQNCGTNTRTRSWSPAARRSRR